MNRSYEVEIRLTRTDSEVVYVQAPTEQAARDLVWNALSAQERRWASLYVVERG